MDSESPNHHSKRTSQYLLEEEETTTIENNWKGIKEALTLTSQEALGGKKHHHKVCISIDILDKIQQRKNKKTAINSSRTRAEKVMVQAEYTKANKHVKRNIRVDKQKYVEELETTAEKTAREGNMRQPYYDTTKKLARKYSTQRDQSKTRKAGQSSISNGKGTNGQNILRNA
ncbi:unnamed protein product [Schistosoma curassoni]|uniref:Uncharacterized protein n=1 Tax=Schistosoma curassoni TaxID=6186 RepID=A0A183KNS6_9TREM|nr:unnamed protein product [Schistosoma curassoni]